MHALWTGYARTALAVAVAIVVAAPALAQNTTSAIGGRVTGSDGKPIPGATVTIVHVESGSSTTATADGEGRYAARGLRVGGPYRVTARSGSFADTEENVFLPLAEMLALDIQLPRPATVIITGRGGADRFNQATMGSGTRLVLNRTLSPLVR